MPGSRSSGASIIDAPAPSKALVFSSYSPTYIHQLSKHTYPNSKKASWLAKPFNASRALFRTHKSAMLGLKPPSFCCNYTNQTNLSCVQLEVDSSQHGTGWYGSDSTPHMTTNPALQPWTVMWWTLVILRKKKIRLAIKLQWSFALLRLANQTLALSSQRSYKNSLSNGRARSCTWCASL